MTLEMKTATEKMPAPDALPRSPADDQFVCQCMSVTRDDLREAMCSGAATVKDLSAQTGAGTVCGGCLPKLAELTAETLWAQARCLGIIERNENVRSFRFEIPASFADTGFEAGQRIVVQAIVTGLPSTALYADIGVHVQGLLRDNGSTRASWCDVELAV